MFKYSVNTNTLSPKLSNAKIAELAAEVRLDGIEWGLPALDKAGQEIKEMARVTADHGLQVVGYINGGKIWKSDQIKRWAEVVASVGGKSLRVAHPWIAWDYNESLHQRMSYHEIFRLAKDSLSALMEIAKEHGIRFVLEMHSGALTASSLAAARLMEGCDPRYIGVIYDPANGIVEGSMRPRSDVEVLGAYLAYVHVKNITCPYTGQFHERPVRRARWEYKTCPPPYGIVDYLEVCFALKLGKFDGWVSFEEFWKVEEAATTLSDALAFMKECERQAPGAPVPPFTTFND